MSPTIFVVNHLCSHYPVLTLHHQEIVDCHVLKWDNSPTMSSVLG